MNRDFIEALIEWLKDQLRDLPDNQDLGGREPMPAPKSAVKTRKLAVVIGHTERAKGAVSPWIGSEWDFHHTDAVMKAIRSAAEGTIVDARFLTFDPMAGGYHARCKAMAKEINAWGADLVVELHFNSFRTSQANGTETLHTGTKASLKYAELLQSCAVDCFGLNDRRLVLVPKVTSRGGGLIRRVRAPAALIEPGFGSNKNDALAMREHWPEFAKDLISIAAK